MSNKEKEIISTNLLAIREEKGYSQKELASILGVSERMICNYETNFSNLPPDKALLLAKKWNYSLDWIYCNTDNNLDRINLKNYSKEECIKFLVDIRDFFICSDDKITLSINNSYWEYINKVNEIKHSSKTPQEKKREIAQLNGSYQIVDKTNISWKYSTNISNFISMINFGQDSCCIFASDNPANSTSISEEQIKEATDFLNLLTNTTDNE